MPTSPPIPTVDQFRYHCDLEVRFRDLDAMGHVNNAVYFTYFEVGRSGYTRAAGMAADDEADPRRRYPFILLDASCRYLAAASINDTLRLHVRTSRLGTKSSVFEYLITRRPDDAPVAVGHTTQVAFDYATGRTISVPEALRSAIESFEGSSLEG